jgi:hypothetical protein
MHVGMTPAPVGLVPAPFEIDLTGVGVVPRTVGMNLLGVRIARKRKRITPSFDKMVQTHIETV